MDDTIDAPATVEEGTNATIEVTATESRTLRITDTLSGETFTVQVGSDKKARFELPSTSVAGTTLLIVDENDYSKGAIIVVVPGSSV